MPVYDFECRQGHLTESVQDLNTQTIRCRVCGKKAKRIISASGQYCSNEDADWVKTVLEVVGNKPDKETQEFRRHPTRSNLKAWMEAKGVRHMEPGEEKEASRKYVEDRPRIVKHLCEWFNKQSALEVRS